MKAASGKAMRITWHEMKKAITSPVIVVLLVLFIVFNGFQIFSQSFLRVELKIVNDITSSYGNAITEAGLLEMQGDIDGDAEQLGAQQDAEMYLEEMTYEKYEQVNPAGQKAIDRLSLNYTYYALGMDLEARYKAIDMEELRKDLFDAVPMEGRLAEFMGGQFTKWENRYKEIVETEEYKEWFFAGHYRMHSELFRSLVKNIAVQSILLVVLTTALIANYEVEQRTQFTIYTTKKGRSIIWHKFRACLHVSLLAFVLLAGCSLGLFFIVYDYSSVWNTAVSSGLNWEYKLPYITWWPLTVWQYLVLVLVAELFVVLIVSVLTFMVSLYIRNSYFTWIICLSMLIALFLLPSFLNAFPVLQFIASLNLSLLLMNPHMYFTGGTTFTMIQYFELWTILLWLVISLAGSGWAIRRFYKRDVA